MYITREIRLISLYNEMHKIFEVCFLCYTYYAQDINQYRGYMKAHKLL